MPSVSPFSMANEMPFTARTTPLRVWKKVRRLVTLSNGMIGEAERASQPRSAELYSAVSQRCTLPGVVRRQRLVLCLLNGWCFAARIFLSRRGASDEHIPQWICKERATKPGAKRTAALWVAPSLACGFVARRSQPHCGGCSLLAPRHRPNWAQQNTSHLGDTTLVDGFLLSPEEGGAAAASTLTEEEAIVFPAP